ncbi:MAG: putative LPS assembly protein LptD, partial [Bacteroidota bacterium]
MPHLTQDTEAVDTSAFEEYSSVEVTSSKTKQVETDSTKITLSQDALEAPVKYSARDSIENDFLNKKIYLYGGAKVEYTSTTLEAGFIELDLENNVVLAEHVLDSAGQKVELPHFVDGEQDFHANRMRYNFKTEKGIVYDVTTKQQNLYVLGAKAKFRRDELTVPGTDSTFQRDVVYNEDAIFTTCNHPDPHYGIRSKKQKVIAGKVVVVGPSNLEIAGIPTPIYLPFGFFPTTEKRTQGLIFPRGYEYSEQAGFGLRNIGYYVPISPYMDATASFDIYLKGRWNIALTTNFKRRYKFDGSANISFGRDRRENAQDGSISFVPSYKFGLTYNQARSAHPSRTLGGRIDIDFGSYQATNFVDAQSTLQVSNQSNFSYRQSFPGRPFSLSAGFRHSQSRRSGTMTMSFPDLNFQTITLYPFKSKKKRSKESWYEKIAFNYRTEARAQFSGVDTLAKFFQRDSLLNGMKLGARHTTNTNMAFRV